MKKFAIIAIVVLGLPAQPAWAKKVIEPTTEVFTDQPLTTAYSPVLELNEAEESLDDLERNYRIADDPAQQAIVMRIVRELTAVSDNPSAQYVVKIVVSGDNLNAESRPGGVIVMYDAFLKLYADDLPALAAVLAHEIAHCQARHHAMREFIQSAGQPKFSESRWQNAFIRQKEFEADRYGALLLARAGYSVDDMIREMRLTARKVGDRPAYINANHPLHRERILALEDFKSSLAEVKKMFDGANISLAFQNFDQAELLYKRVLTTFPQSRAAKVNLASIYALRAERLLMGNAAFQMPVLVTKSDVPAFGWADANAQGAAEHLKNAQALLDQVDAQGAFIPASHAVRAQVLNLQASTAGGGEKKKLLRDATLSLNRARTAEPHRSEYLLIAAQNALFQGHPRLAATLGEAALKRDDSPSVIRAAASLYRAAGNKAKFAQMEARLAAIDLAALDPEIEGLRLGSRSEEVQKRLGPATLTRDFGAVTLLQFPKMSVAVNNAAGNVEALYITRGEQTVGGVQIGMRVEEVVARWGGPQRRVANAFGAANAWIFDNRLLLLFDHHSTVVGIGVIGIEQADEPNEQDDDEESNDEEE